MHDGRVVGGRYRILRRLRAGGMGVVFEATRIDTHEPVALKLIALPNAVLGEPVHDLQAPAYQEALRRFEREARAASAVRTPHIVRVFEAGMDEPTRTPFMAMELLRGEDLHTLLRRAGRLPVDVAARIAAQACAGLGEAHAAGVVHRDVKPGNLFLAQGEKGEVVVKVLDFGIAKIKPSHETADLTRTGNLLGSLQYMSPEQIKGARSVDARADLWSLGVVLFRMLTGTTPFRGAETTGETMLAICTQPPDDVREHARVPDRLAALVARALRMDPAERFPTAAAMRAELEALLPAGVALTSAMLERAAPTQVAHAAVAPAPTRRIDPEGWIPATADGPAARDSTATRRRGWMVATFAVALAAGASVALSGRWAPSSAQSEGPIASAQPALEPATLVEAAPTALPQSDVEPDEAAAPASAEPTASSALPPPRRSPTGATATPTPPTTRSPAARATSEVVLPNWGGRK